MTAGASARNRVRCPVAGCTYSMDNAGSVPAHLAMSHPEVPMDVIAPKRPAPSAGAKAILRALAESAAEPDEFGHVGVVVQIPTTASSGEEGPAQPGPGSETPGHVLLASITVRDNVREDLGDLEALAASIAEHGLLQPLLVQPDGAGWVLVDGHRRLAASAIAGLTSVPVHVAAGELLTGGTRKGVQVEANAHRRELNPLELAQAYRDELAEGITQAELARRHGIAAPTIANALRLLEAAPKVQELLRAGSITAAHAKAVLGLPAADQERLATGAAERGVSAHQLESDAAYLRKQEADRKTKTKANAAATKNAIAALTEAAVPFDAGVIVSVGYDMDGAGIRAAVEKAGWATLMGWGTADDSCGCTSWRVQCEGGKSATAVRICADTAHEAARAERRDAKRKADEAARAADQQALRAALVEALPSVGPTLLRILLRDQDNYNGSTWTQYGELADAEVIKRLASHLTNGYGAKPIPVDKVVAALRAEIAS